MEEPPGRFRSLLRELKRRNVYRVAVTYAVVAFVVVQAADLIFPALEIPSWAYSLVVVLTLLGFPVALVLAWAFEMTAEGVRRTPELAAGETVGAGTDGAGDRPSELAHRERGTSSGPVAGSQRRFALKALVGLGLLTVAGVAGWYLTGGGGEKEPRAGDRSIAVLPFENLSGTEEARPFVNGIHDDLLTRLSNVAGLEVISRTSVMRYRDSELSLPAIADSLGVKWVMEGGVQQMGGELQVNAQLIDPHTDTHAWADSYRRDLTAENLFAIQTEITKKIARSLEARLSPGEEERVERTPTENLTAYRLYVRGRSHLDQRTEAGTREAMEYFWRALERDSSYALAWVGLADAILLREAYGYGRTGDSGRVDPERAIRRALAIDSTVAEAHASLGLLYMNQERGPAGLRRLERAVELQPSYARAHHWLGLLLGVLDRAEWGLRELQRAAELDPLSPSIQAALSGLYYSNGRFDEMLRTARRARELQPDLGTAHFNEGLALTALGRYGEAVTALERGRELSSPTSEYGRHLRAFVAVARAGSGDTTGAREMLSSFGDDPAGAFNRAVALTALGQHDAALAAFRRAAVEENWFRLVMFRDAPVLEPLRDRPEYRQMLRDANEAWGLGPDGSLP